MGRKNGEGSMADTAREALAREIVRWMEDDMERSWILEHPKAGAFVRCARFSDWLRVEAIRAVATGSEEYGGIANKLVSMWLMNLSNFLTAYNLAIVAAIEKNLGGDHVHVEPPRTRGLKVK